VKDFVEWCGRPLFVPLWVAVNAADLRSKGVAGSLAIVDPPELPKALAVFSEEEFGDRLIEANNLAGFALVKYGTFAEFQQLLITFLWIGGQNVAIDPVSPSNSPRYQQIGGDGRSLYRAIAKSGLGDSRRGGT
jgi:hypothetical protein